MSTSIPVANPSTVKSSVARGDIRVLPPHLVNKIAAGEVVERPASVVKELVENAIDAGATTIAIDASHGGRTLRIADNGHGMTPENAEKAFLNHATSKILTDADLERIATFGFRGEALASIAAVSQMACHTRTADAEHGTQIAIAADGTPQAKATGCSTGTVMDIQQLFGNVPARLKFLKKPATELAHVEETVQRLALANPEIHFTLTLDSRQALKTSGTGQLKTAFSELYKIPAGSEDFIPVLLKDGDGMAVEGLTSLPSVMKSSRKFMLTYVNGRAIKCSVMAKAIEAAYQSLMEHKKYPFVALFLTLPLDAVDVNVHPTKREVRYAQPNQVFGIVKSAVRQALEGHGIFPKPQQYFPQSAPYGAQNGTQGQTAYPAQAIALPPMPVQSIGSSAIGIGLGQSVQSPLWHAPNLLNETYSASDKLPEPPQPLSAEQSAAQVKVIGQLFNTYILLETPQGLMVVDQHIASERTVFEQLKTAEADQTIDTQQVLASEVLAVSPAQREVLTSQRAALEQLGFNYSIGDDGVQLTGVPMVYLDKHNPQHWFDEVLTQMAEGDGAELDIEHLLATMSCHRAVRAGDILTHEEMTDVIQRWLACTLPWTCPHGRPIAHTIKADDLNRFFHRPSLPVNSVASR